MTASTADKFRTVIAPGTNILSTNNMAGTDRQTGTSQAAPMVAGIVARCFAGARAFPPRPCVASDQAESLQSAGMYACMHANDPRAHLLDAHMNVCGNDRPLPLLGRPSRAIELHS